MSRGIRYLLVALIALSGTFGYCATVQHWTIQAAFTVASMLAAALAAGIQHSPHDLAAGQELVTATLQAYEPRSTAAPLPALPSVTGSSGGVTTFTTPAAEAATPAT